MNLSELIQRDTRANQPDPGIVGRLYCVTDEGNIVERDNGTSWESYTGASSPPALKVYMATNFS